MTSSTSSKLAKNYIESIKKQSKSENFNALPILVGRSGNSIAAMLSCMLMGIPFSPLNYKQPSVVVLAISGTISFIYFIISIYNIFIINLLWI